MSSSNGVWKWICGILLSMLVTGTAGIFAGSYFTRVSEDKLIREIRVERSEYVNDFVSKQISPRLDQLERGQSVILQELRTTRK